MSDKLARVHHWAGTTPWTLALMALRLALRVYLWGPPGCGKSVLAMADTRVTYQVTLSEDFTLHDLIGHYLPAGEQFVWHDGPVALAMKQGARLVLNEIQLASGPVRDFLRGVLDRPETGGIAMPNGERLVAAAGFAVVATSNSPPTVLDAALRSRFEVELELRAPNPDLVSALNGDFAGLGDALADSFKDPSRAIDPRKLLAMARFIKKGVPTRTAALMCFGVSAPDLLSAANARGVELP